MTDMTNSMRVYKAVVEIQDIFNYLDNNTHLNEYWPDSLKKARTLINNAEYNLAQTVAKQALQKEVGAKGVE
jgi:hypothetical protein